MILYRCRSFCSMSELPTTSVGADETRYSVHSITGKRLDVTNRETRFRVVWNWKEGNSKRRAVSFEPMDELYDFHRLWESFFKAEQRRYKNGRTNLPKKRMLVAWDGFSYLPNGDEVLEKIFLEKDIKQSRYYLVKFVGIGDVFCPKHYVEFCFPREVARFQRKKKVKLLAWENKAKKDPKFVAK